MIHFLCVGIALYLGDGHAVVLAVAQLTLGFSLSILALSLVVAPPIEARFRGQTASANERANN